MFFKDIIRKKRDGGSLTSDQINRFAKGLADGSLPSEQAAALAMAIAIRSMSAEETGALTTAMARSGSIIDWSKENLSGPIVDKHSTGGIGDKVSFLLAPIAAACGCFVPMISGRGLGHTGGTLDKIESIPGYTVTPDLGVFRRTVTSIGCAIIGQTQDLAPADRKLYAIRDVTGTVECIPLITASILSKKIAAGNQGLVMDIKTGNGAFMARREDAKSLAEAIVAAAKAANLKTRTLITDMSQVLGSTAGNAVEIKECVDFFHNTKRDPRLEEVVLGLCAEVLIVGGLEEDPGPARQRAEAVLASGAASEIFARMVAALGGPKDFMERPDHYLPKAPVALAVLPDEAGYLSGMDARAVGNAIISLGGGRRKPDDRLDLSVGLTDVAPVGVRVDQDRPLAIIHASSEDHAQAAAQELKRACQVTQSAPTLPPIIYDRLV